MNTGITVALILAILIAIVVGVACALRNNN